MGSIYTKISELNMTWHQEANKALKEIMLVYCLDPKEMCAFLSATLVGQMELMGYSEEFAKKTFDHMFEKFKEKREMRK